MMTEIKRIIVGGVTSFKRGGLVSFAAVLVVTITLSVVTLIILLQAVLYSSLNQIKEKVDVTIYFNTDARESEIMSLKATLEKLPEVRSTTYTSASEALQIFRERHKSDYPTIAALDEIGVNPLGAYINVKAKEVSQYEGIASFLNGDSALVNGSSSIIDKVNYHKNKLVIDRLNNIISGAQKLGFLITIILIAISIAVSFNTVRLAIFISKEEIGVMRLVGASKMRVRGPFMVEGAIYGALATLVTLVIFFPATIWLGNNMTTFLGLNLYDYYMASFFQIFAILLVSGILLGVISSFLAIRRYLNK